MKVYKGEGVLNSIINKLPFELHVPGGYQFCGPGTRLQERLAKGQQGINPLDSFCKDHDIAYSKNSSLADRHKADWELENRAWERVKSKDASLGEKSAAWLVTTGMKLKRKLGMGHKPTSFRRDVLRQVSNVLKESLSKNPVKRISATGLKVPSTIALRAARVAVKKVGGRRRIRVPRVIPYDKSGGILPLMPIFAALGALGSLAGGAAAVAKTTIDAKNAQKKLEEQQRHNKSMEEIGKKGSGLYVRKTARGFGLFLKKQQGRGLYVKKQSKNH